MSDLPVIARLVRSRRKTIALIVNPDGSLEVRAPLRAPTSAIHKLVREKADWIHRHQQSARPSSRLEPAQRFQDGALFLFLGQTYELRILPAENQKLAFKERFTLGSRWLPQAETLFINWYRTQAGRILTERTALIAGRHDLLYQGVRITSARTRWGSCSASGNLNFTWRLVMAPQEISDYVIVHELAHTRIRAHNRAFWDLVARLDPDYKRKRAWLRSSGHQLDLFIPPSQPVLSL